MLFKVCLENYEDNFILKFYTKIISLRQKLRNKVAKNSRAPFIFKFEKNK